MKALTVRQPWASLIIGGKKDVENRNWPTSYRGRIAIHAAVSIASPEEIQHLANLARAGIVELDEEYAIEALPRGAILGTVELAEVRMNYDSPWALDGYSFQWILRDPEPYSVLEPVSGKLGLWDWDPAAEPEPVV